MSLLTLLPGRLCGHSPVWRRLASTVFQHFVAADDASETLAGLKRIHGLMPYFMLKTALRISNPVGMIRSERSVHQEVMRLLLTCVQACSICSWLSPLGDAACYSGE